MKRVRADAVIYYTNEYEEAASWDYPSVKKALEKENCKVLCYGKMKYPPHLNADFSNRLKTDLA